MEWQPGCSGVSDLAATNTSGSIPKVTSCLYPLRPGIVPLSSTSVKQVPVVSIGTDCGSAQAGYPTINPSAFRNVTSSQSSPTSAV